MTQCHPEQVTLDGEEVEVKEAKVGGCTSQGMLCDAPMLGWTGGGAGNAALVPDSFEPGDAPPERRPRMDGKADGEHRRGCGRWKTLRDVDRRIPVITSMARTGLLRARAGFCVL